MRVSLTASQEGRPRREASIRHPRAPLPSADDDELSNPAPTTRTTDDKMLALPTATLGFSLPTTPAAVAPRATGATMVYGEPRPVQIIPSVLPADWANSASLPP